MLAQAMIVLGWVRGHARHRPGGGIYEGGLFRAHSDDDRASDPLTLPRPSSPRSRELIKAVSFMAPQAMVVLGIGDPPAPIITTPPRFIERSVRGPAGDDLPLDRSHGRAHHRRDAGIYRKTVRLVAARR